MHKIYVITQYPSDIFERLYYYLKLEGNFRSPTTQSDQN